MRIVERLINELVYDRVQTYAETLETPAEYVWHCSECGREDGDEHVDGCKLGIVEEFLNQHSHAIERWVTAQEPETNDAAEEGAQLEPSQTQEPF